MPPLTRLQSASKKNPQAASESSLFDNLKDVVFQTDRNGMWTYLNPAWQEITGFSVSESLGTPYFNYIHPDDQKRSKKLVTLLLEQKKDTYQDKVRYLTKEVEFRWIEVNATLLFDKNHQVLGTCGTLSDITEQRGLEEALEDYEERFRDLIENANDLIQSVDKEGHFSYVNKKWKETMGYSEEEVNTLYFPNLIKKDCQARILKILREIAKGQSFNHVETTLIAKDGREIILDGNLNAYIKKGQFQATRGIFRDITESKKTRAALIESEERFRDLFDNAGDLIQAADIDGHLLYVNKKWKDTLGYNDEDIKTIKFTDIVNKDSLPHVWDLYKQVSEGKAFDNEELVVVAKNGKEVILKGNISAHIKDNKVIAIRGILHDITQNKVDESALLRRDQILEAERFAHERFLLDTSWEKSVQQVIETLGKATKVSRVYVFKNHIASNHQLLTSHIYEWVNQGINPQIDNPELQNLSWQEFGLKRWANALLNRRVVACTRHTYVESERALLEMLDIQSILIVPIFVNDSCWGFIGFDDCITERIWATIEVHALKSFANLIGMTIMRQQAEVALKHRDAILEAENFAHKKFLTSTSWENNIHQILKHLGLATEVGRVSIYKYDPQALTASQVFEWVAPGITPQITNPALQNLPWKTGPTQRWGQALMTNRPVCGIVKELPPLERQFLGTLGVVSVAIVPIFAGSEPWGFIGFDDCKTERSWSDNEIDSLQSFANLLGLMILRQLSDGKLHEQMDILERFKEATVDHILEFKKIEAENIRLKHKATLKS